VQIGDVKTKQTRTDVIYHNPPVFVYQKTERELLHMGAHAFSRSMKLQLTGVLALWIFTVYTAIALYSSLYDNQFVQFGPNARLHVVYIAVNTWAKWGGLTFFIIVTQIVKVFADEVISPWILNSVMDHKCSDLAQSSATDCPARQESWRRAHVQAVCQTYYLFSASVQFINISITVAQLDLVAVLISTDLLVSLYTTQAFLDAKRIPLYNYSSPPDSPLHIPAPDHAPSTSFLPPDKAPSTSACVGQRGPVDKCVLPRNPSAHT